MRPRNLLPSERGEDPQRQTDPSRDLISTLNILEFFENGKADYQQSYSSICWQLLLKKLTDNPTKVERAQTWGIDALPRHMGEVLALERPSPDISFLHRKSVDVHVCDFWPDKAALSAKKMKDFEKICREKPEGASLRWIHVPVGLGIFQSTLEDIFLHCDPIGTDKSHTFVKSGLPGWKYPEVNMLTFINRADHQARIKTVKNLSSMSNYSSLIPDDGLCETVRKDLKWRSKTLGKDLSFWESVMADFPTPISEKVCQRQNIGPLVLGEVSSADFAPQALSKNEQFRNASLVHSKLRAFNRADGFLLTFANTSGIDYLGKTFQSLIQSPGYDMLYNSEASVLAHTMHAFRDSGTRRWKGICEDDAAIWLIVYLFTEAAVTPHNIRGGRSAIDIIDAYMEIMQSLKKKKDEPWSLGRSPDLVREYQKFIEEIKTVQSITSDNLNLLRNIHQDIQAVENKRCGHTHCMNKVETMANRSKEKTAWDPESMKQRLYWAIKLLSEREADLTRMQEHFQKALKDLLDICIIEQNDRSVVADSMNKAILLFTGITVVFLPLSFVTSYLGMNLSDIRDTHIDQVWFWKYLGSTGLVVSVISILYTTRLQQYWSASLTCPSLETTKEG